MAARINDEWVCETMNINIEIAKKMREMQSKSKDLKQRAKDLLDEAKELDSDFDILHDQFLADMLNNNVDKVKDDEIEVTIRDNPLSVLVHDIDSLPDEYKRTKTIVEADKTKLKQDKPDLDGVSYVNVKKLMLK